MRRLLLAAALTISTPLLAADLKVIRDEGDLPQTRYPLSEPASTAFMSDAFLKTTVPALRAEAERLLASSRFENEQIETRLHSGLAAIAILEGRPNEAERRLIDHRPKMSKPQLKAIGGLANEALAAGLAAPKARRCTVAGERIAMRLKGTDPQVVRDEVLLRLSQAGTASVPYYAGTLVGFLDETVKMQKSVDLMEGLTMALYRVGAEHLPACRMEMASAYRTWLNDAANAPRDIWTEREPAASLFTDAKPVVAAVWDTGVDYSLFPGLLAIDPAEPLDGRDNDGNGIVDDVHGPTYDYHARPTPFAIAPPSAWLAPRLAFSQAMDKGQLDLNYGLDTPEARIFAARGREASTAEQGEDVDGSNENMGRGHGTFVASQIGDGAPYVRLYNVRLMPWGYDPKPIKRAEPEMERFAAAMVPAVKRMQGANVRVVNMSWGWTIDDAARSLLENGLETDPTRARERGRAMYDTGKAASTKAMAAAPGILFVAAAGNDNQTDETLAAYPQSIAAPNMIVVGATGQSGQPTSFTTFGKKVDIYARGEGALGRMPGGTVAHWSGTSMAAPLVSRAAAQMLAVNPKLTPAQLVEGLKATATEGQGGMKLLHAARAVEWARSRR